MCIINKKIVFIIGMHRCGTSLLSQCLVNNGFSIGKNKNKDKNWQNPNGYFENDKFTQFHDNLLRFNNSTWNNLNTDIMNYTKKHVEEYRNLLEIEFENETKILIKDPRLTFFVSFLNEVCENNCYFIFASRNKEECCKSLSKAQNITLKHSENIYDKTHKYYKNNKFLKVDYHDIIYNHKKEMNKILDYINTEKYKDTSEFVNLDLYRNRFYPIEEYPHRSPLDVCNVLHKYIYNKSVCDPGCGAGDLLEYMRLNNLCKDVKGIEMNNNRYVKERTYVTNANMFNINIPDVDVYFLWLGKEFPYEKFLSKINSDKIIINMDGSKESHKIFECCEGIHLIEEIMYEYDEEKFILKEELENYINKLKIMQQNRDKIDPNNPKNWTIKGKRLVKIYKFIKNKKF